MGDVEELELADATREQAQALKSHTKALSEFAASVAFSAKASRDIAKGEKGDAGDTGPVGPRGPIGESVTGPRGPKGETGDRGSAGDRGGTGPSGKNGRDGKDGVGPDERVRVSVDDPTAGFLADKLTAGTGVEIRKAGGKRGERLVIDAKSQGGGGGGQSGIIAYDDGVAVGTGQKVSFDGGDPVTISGGLIHVPVGSGAGGTLAVADEGTPLTPGATSVDFAGAGVTATAVGTAVTVTIPGGSGGIPQGGPATAAINMDGFGITGMAEPSDSDHAATKSYVDNHATALDQVLDEGNDADGFAITGLADPTDPQDAATKAYVDENAGVLTKVTVNLDAADIATLSSVPVEVVAAPGAGKVIVPVSASFQYKVGTEPFAQSGTIVLTSPAGIVSQGGAAGFDQAEDSTVTLLRATTPSGEQADFANQPVAVSLDGEDPSLTGSILTSSLVDGGADYAEDDEFTLTATVSDGDDATGVVDTVDGGGVILTYHLTGAGTRFAVDEVASITATTGIGTGGSIVVDTITPLSDGTARLTVWYGVMDLLV